MAKFTKTQWRDLSATLAQLERVQAFIASDRIAVCVVDKVATTTLHHTRAYVPGVDRTPDDARPLCRIAKDIGSELCLLPDAIRNLKRILES